MYEYNIYLGYQRSFGGFPILGSIRYPYPLQKGDTIILSNQLFDELNKVANEVGKQNLKNNQSYRIGAIHHMIDSETSLAPNIYLVTESDYLEKYKD